MSRENQKMKSEKIRQEIIETALQIAIEEGFEALSLRKLGNRMNYTTGIIYYHFKDKDELVDAIQELEGRKLGKIIQESVKGGASFIENLYQIYHNIMLLAYHQSEEYNLVVMNRHSKKMPFNHQHLDTLCRFLKKAVTDGEIRPCPIEETAFAIWTSFMGFNLIISQRSDISLAEAEALFIVQFHLIENGLRGGGIFENN